MMQNTPYEFGPRFWIPDKLPTGVSTWIFKVNRCSGNSGYHSYQPFPSGITLRIITAGKWLVKMNDETFTANPGDIFCAIPGTLIEFYTLDKSLWEWYEIQFTGADAMKTLNLFGCGKKHPVYQPPKPEKAKRYFKLIYDYFNHPNRSEWKLLSTFFKLVDICQPEGETEEQRLSPNVLVSRACEIIESIPNMQINVAELADILNINRTTLRRAFISQLGTNPVNYLKNRKIFRAEELLMNTYLKISDIAESTGFKEEKYFIRCFREINQISPGKWRNQRLSPASPS
jgi:AraC-like DNA-binding protein